MIRFLSLAVLVPMTMVTSQSSHASDFCRYLRCGTHRNICWPKPYIYPDRAAVAAPFAVMINNGWERQNLLGDHHFTSDGSKMTTAGDLKIRWILTQAPMNRRSIFVQRTWLQETDAMRLQAVQVAASKVLPDGIVADVQPTHLQVEGRSAETVDKVNTQFHESMPLPILPAPRGDSSEE